MPCSQRRARARTETDLMSRTNYIFVDFENVQERELNRIANKPAKVVFVLGERQKNLPVDLVQLMLKYSAQVSLLKAEVNGKNALDLVIAREIGAESEKDQNGYFHVISRDKDFDALIKHLKSGGVLAARHESFAEIPLLMNAAERVKRMADHFKSNPDSRPKKKAKLESKIHAEFGKTLSPEEVEDTIRKLAAGRVLSVSAKGEVAYKL